MMFREAARKLLGQEEEILSNKTYDDVYGIQWLGEKVALYFTPIISRKVGVSPGAEIDNVWMIEFDPKISFDSFFVQEWESSRLRFCINARKKPWRVKTSTKTVDDYGGITLKVIPTT